MSWIRGIEVRKGSFELSIPEIEILDRGITGIVGPSGSGKSTLFRVLMGLDESPGWSWKLADSDLATLPVERRRLGVVFQSYELFPHLTVVENIAFAAEARGIGKQESEEKVAKLLKSLDLERTKATRAVHLSGGEKQRVALARALVGNPVALLLDEPFSALDEDLKVQARTLVGEVTKDLQIPVLLITHDERDLNVLSARSYRLKSGRIVGLTERRN